MTYYVITREFHYAVLQSTDGYRCMDDDFIAIFASHEEANQYLRDHNNLIEDNTNDTN